MTNNLFLDKILANILIIKLSFMKLISIGGVHEHIMEIRNIAIQLKKLEVEIFGFFFFFALHSEYSPISIWTSYDLLYNTKINGESINL